LVVSIAGGTALKLIFADSFNTGLNVEVISIDFGLEVSCAFEAAAIATKKNPDKNNLIIFLFIISFSNS